MNVSPQRRGARWSVIIVIGLFILITVIFVFAFVMAAESEIAAPQVVSELSADADLETANALLQNADPESGARLVEQFGCVACHRLGVTGKIAPPFADIAERAALRRPPLTAAAYLYQSIINPTSYVVTGYQPAMPQDYSERLSDQELGDIIAYLLTPAAH